MGQFTLGQHLEVRRRNAAVGKRLADGRGLGPTRHEDVYSLGSRIGHALHEGGEVRIGHRRAIGPHDRTTRFGEALGERGLGIDARTIVGHQRIGLADALLIGPGAEGIIELRDGDAGAHDIGRLLGHDRGRRIHHHHQLLRFGGDFSRAERLGRQGKTGNDVDIVAHHQLLRQAPRHVGGRAARIALDDLDGLAGHFIAMLGQIEVDARLELVGGVGKWP